jgi:hypothetical protein
MNFTNVFPTKHMITLYKLKSACVRYQGQRVDQKGSKGRAKMEVRKEKERGWQQGRRVSWS